MWGEGSDICQIKSNVFKAPLYNYNIITYAFSRLKLQAIKHWDLLLSEYLLSMEVHTFKYPILSDIF